MHSDNIVSKWIHRIGIRTQSIALQYIFIACFSVCNSAQAQSHQPAGGDEHGEIEHPKTEKSVDPLLEEKNLIANTRISDTFQMVANQTQPTRSALSIEEIETLYTATLNHPVAKLDMVPFYDPQSLTGFCFGRAMTAHLNALEMGLAPESVKKLFIVGDLKARKAEKTEWRFHVTTIVKAKVPTGDGSDGHDREDRTIWVAIDPIMGQTLTMSQWIETTANYWDTWHLDVDDVDGPQAEFYVVEPDAVLPDVRAFGGESGDHIIDLAFNPEDTSTHTGIVKLNHASGKLFQLSPQATSEYFLHTNPDPIYRDTSFNFVGLTFDNGFFIAYGPHQEEPTFRNYFDDLIETYVHEDTAISAF